MTPFEVRRCAVLLALVLAPALASCERTVGDDRAAPAARPVAAPAAGPGAGAAGAGSRPAAAPGAGPGGAPAVGSPGGRASQTATLDVGYALGDPEAPITVIEFSDFGCPYCAKFASEIFPVLEREFIATGKVRWRYVPFVLGAFPNGAEAARAAECAAEQGEEAFWRMHDRLYERQRAWRSTGDPGPILHQLAADIAIDGAHFASCYRQNRGAGRTRTANLVARTVVIRATPTFFVNGVRVQGALPADRFRLLFRELLER